MDAFRKVFLAAAGLMLSAVPLSACGDEGEVEQRRLLRHWDSIHIDQDLFTFNLNEDRDYTMGVMFVWQGEKARQHKLNTAGLLERIDALVNLEHSGTTAHSVAWGNSAFTPNKLQEVAPITDDRPYASLLYTTTTLLDQNPEERSARSTSLTIGLLGLGISDWGQTVIHEYWRRDGDEEPFEPQGWRHQISDGGEPTFMLKAEWFRRPWSFRTGPGPGRNADLTYSWDLSVGYYTMASVGAVFRAGRFASPTDVRGAVIDIDPQAGVNKALPRRPQQARANEVYLMIGTRATLVGYNVLLQGQFRDSAFELKNSEVERLVLEASLGVNWTRPSGRRVWFSCTQRSAEHKLAQRRAHTWCGVNYQAPLSL